MNTILKDRVMSLRLRLDSPYPSEVQDAHEMILQWRRTQRLHAITEDNPQQPDNDDDFDGDAA